MGAYRSSNWLRGVFAAIISVSAVSAVSAQSPEPAQPNLDLLLSPGMTVWITDAAGREERVRVVGLSGGVVRTSVGELVRDREIRDIARIRVIHNDPVIEGALIGAGVAIGTGLAMCRLMEPWENCRDDVGPMLRVGAVGAAIGMGVDALIRGRRTIYEAPRFRAAPFVSRHGAGVQVAFSF
jgi:hypothetical protein